MPAAPAELSATLPAELVTDLRQLARHGTAPEPPIRSLTFDQARFEQHGRRLAGAQEVVAGDEGADFLRRLQENAEVLRSAHLALARERADGTALDPGALGLLQDAPLVEQQLAASRSALPRHVLRQLPRLRDQPLSGLPRVYAIAWAWVAHADSRWEPTLLQAFIAAYHSRRELKLVEYRALPAMLKVVLLENLRRLGERAALIQVARGAAHQWVDDPARSSLASLDEIDATLDAHGMAEPFRLTLHQRTDDFAGGAAAGELSIWLARRLPDPTATLARQHRECEGDRRSIEHVLATLRVIHRLDWRRLADRVEGPLHVLARLPGHAAEHEETRDATVAAIEVLAREAGCSETKVAEALVTLAAEAPHPAAVQAAPGYWYAGPGLPQLRLAIGLSAPLPAWRTAAVRRRGAAVACVAGALLLSVLIAAALVATAEGLGWIAVVSGVLLWFPISQLTFELVDRLAGRWCGPTRLPRLALSDGIRAERRTLVVMPVTLTHPDDIAELAKQLERHAIAHREPAVQFALLSDWPDAATEQTAADASLLESARAAVQALNQRHATAEGEPLRFLLLHRARHWSESERRWTGWERRRGQLEQLVQLLADGALAASPFMALGPLSEPAPHVQHLVTLELGTMLPPGGLRALVGMAAHPLNRPRLDEHGRVIGGWTILQPRIEQSLPASQPVSWFNELFADGGVAGEGAPRSSVRQQLFGEGMHLGTGLIDVAAARATLVGRIPEAQVLSHEVLAGAMARCADVDSVVLLDQRALEPELCHARMHRTTRGAWQLLPFIRAARQYDLSPVGRWTLIDSLRRSLVAPMSLLLMLLVIASGILPLTLALAVIAAAGCAGALGEGLARLVPGARNQPARSNASGARAQWVRVFALAAWYVALLLHRSLLEADAIGRALHRHFVSRRGMLEAPPAGSGSRAESPTLSALLSRHIRVPIAAVVLGTGLWLVLDRALAFDTRVVALLFAVWGAAPLAIWWAGRDRPPPRGDRLDRASRAWLHGLARDTWRFHEHLVTAADHHLPPESVQRAPRWQVAHHTSPIGIGSYLLATASAQALGFIGREEMVERLTATVDTLERLPRHRGHWLERYDTRSLAPHAPATISTVESGTLSALLVAVAAACEALAAAAPTLDAAEQSLRRSSSRLQVLGPAPADNEALASVMQLCTEGEIVWPRNAEEYAARRARVQRALADLAELQLDIATADKDARLWLVRDHVACLGSVLRDLAPDASASPQRLRWLAERCRRLALAPDFSLLHDPSSGLLHRGRAVDADRFDAGLHELLAGEARLTSLFAIAKGDVAPAHWHALDRAAYSWRNTIGLRSADGALASHLMPTLLLDAPRGSLLDQAARSAVLVQRDLAQACGTPWGQSSSATAARDADFTYRHAVHGVAALAMRAMGGAEHVVAPYAGAMALPIEPAAALANLQRLEELGARGAMGFIDAIDYTPDRQVHGGEHELVLSHVATHQAFSLIAICNLVGGRSAREWAMGDPLLGAVQSLMHERPPERVPQLATHSPPPPQPRRLQALVQEIDPLAGALPATQLLSSGRHAVVLRDSGAGFSTWDGIALTRWREDLPRDRLGLWFHVRRGADAGARWSSLTAHPAPDPAARYRSRAQADRAVAEATWPDLRSRCTTWVSTEGDCELREVELVNTGRGELVLTLASFAEMALLPQATQDADPALARLFVQAHWSAAEQALYYRRKPSAEGERAVHAVHFLAACSAPVESVQACVDRARWLGHAGSPADPRGDGGLDSAPAAAFGFDAPGEAVDTGFDPIASIAVTLRLAPGATIRLSYGLGAAWNAAAMVRVVERFRSAGELARASELSVATAAVHLDRTGLDADTWRALLQVNTWLTASLSHPRAASSRGAGARSASADRRALLQRGIGGDSSIVLVTIQGEQGLSLLHVLKEALDAWRVASPGIDLVVLHPDRASCLPAVLDLLDQWREQEVAQQTRTAAAGAAAGAGAGAGAGPVGLHLLDQTSLAADELRALRSLARLRLQADGRSLAQQVGRIAAARARDRDRQLAAAALPVEPLRPAAGSAEPLAPPVHAFDAADGGLRFVVKSAAQPPQRWVNLLANPAFHCRVTELGSGDCRTNGPLAHRISGSPDDPDFDDPSEWLLLHDLDSGRVWPLGRAVSDDAPREVVHAPGRTSMRQRLGDIEVTLVWCVDPQLAVRQLGVELRSHAASPRQLRLVSMVEWTLGASREARRSVSTRGAIWVPPAEGEGLPLPAPVRVLQATQNDGAGELGGSTGFLVWRGDADAASGLPPPDTLDDWTCDRTEFFAPTGAIVLPARLNRRDGAGLDPCAGLACHLQLAPGATATRSLLLGHAADRTAAIALLQQAWPVEPAQRLQAQQQVTDRLSGTLRVKTPDAAFDALVNHWLPYQTLAARLWVRGDVDQPGAGHGRHGSRDPLQDAAGLINHAPELLAAQIRIHAAHQASLQAPQASMQAGVVAHSSRPASDDLLWLPWACALYRRRTGDASLLDERVPVPDRDRDFEGADLLRLLTHTEDEPTIYEIAARAIDLSLRTGSHGLPLIGTGAGHEAMDHVGHPDTGESVWLAWLACAVVGAMLPIAASRGDATRVAAWTSARRGWRTALDSQAWDGQWYRRGFLDDGTPVGSASADECRIDLAAQAWAVLSGAGDQRRAAQAVASAERLLHDRENRLVRLFDPPLHGHSPRTSGAHRYSPGVLLNGGQDNLAAVWMLMAVAELRDAAAAWGIFTAVSPAHRCADPAVGAKYALEPFAVARGVCSQPPHTGRGMGSWDSAAPGWMLRAAVESICGIALAQDTLAVRPCMPPHWDEIEVTIRHHGRSHRIVICADPTTLQRAQEREEGARRIAVGQTLALDRLVDGSVHLVDAASSTVAARQDQFEEGAFTIARAPDE